MTETSASVTFTATRDQLVDALTRLDASVPVSGPAAGLINAESMADAIIEALAEVPEMVHYHWPPPHGGFSAGDLWSGNLDRVTCPACRAAQQLCPGPAECVNGPFPHQWHTSCQHEHDGGW